LLADEPRHHQLPEHLVPARLLIQANDPVAAAEGVKQLPHPR
jgi:uncharacterized protein HemY